MECLHTIDSTHELQAVHKALKTIQKEKEFTQEQVDLISTYFHYLYSIGFHEGRRQLSHRKEVVELNEAGEIIQTFPSSYEVENLLGVTKGAVGKSIKYGHKCKGRIFSWLVDYQKKLKKFH